MHLEKTDLPGVLIIQPKVFSDNRGYFMETYHRKRYRDHGIEYDFVQDNLSRSVKDTLRGLHFQVRRPQAKLIQVVWGEIFDVAVDIRGDSPAFLQWTGAYLSGENKHQMIIPEGFAHGFCVLSETALVWYKCSDFYVPDDEGGIHYLDPTVGVDWPVKTPRVSEKDRRLYFATDLSPSDLFSPETR
jgi:dTDP-4-dehydrorhamnose 3,5-epimerase